MAYKNGADTRSRWGRDVTERHRSQSEQTAPRRDAKVATEGVQLGSGQLGLSRVATLVARGAPPQAVLAVAVEEAARVLPVESAAIGRFEPDGTCTTVAAWSAGDVAFPVGRRWNPDGKNVTAVVFRTGRPARLNDFSDAFGPVGVHARDAGYRSAVAVPIAVEGRLWGVLSAASSSEEPLPADTEAGLASFAELLGTAIANAESRSGLARLADEQAALRRVAVLVAQQPSPDEVFTAVTEVVAPLLGADLAAMHVYPGDGTATTIAGWSAAGPMLPIGTRLPLDSDSVAARIFHTGAAARQDSYATVESAAAEIARGLHLRSAVGAPIVVEGRLWGSLMAATRGVEPLPEDAATRIAAFTELVATAVSNAQAREALEGLLDEQAALRRVATLVAQGVPPGEIFSAVSAEIGHLFGSDAAAVIRFDHDAPALVYVGVSNGIESQMPVGTRWELDDSFASTQVFRTGRSARVEMRDASPADEHVADALRRVGVRSTVASPIVVDDRIWGVIGYSSTRDPLPADAEERLERFTALVATAVANAESREVRARLTEQQDALRRVATLVAEGVEPAELFTVMAAEIGRVCDIPATSVVRYQSDGTATELANYRLGSPRGLFPVGVRMNIEGVNILRLVRDSAAPARIDDYAQTSGEMAEIVRRSGITSTVGVPIVVGGRVWGSMVGSTTGTEPLAQSTPWRMSEFTELLATAIENAESREALERLADEQAALRRMATLVAQGVQPAEIFAVVSEEVARLFKTDFAVVARFEHDDRAIAFVGVANGLSGVLRVGARWDFDDAMATEHVYRTGRSARISGAELFAAAGPATRAAGRLGLVSTVASPIVVEGRLWGAVSASAREEMPADAEERLENFGDLVATAIANADSKSELAASRRRIVAAADDTRRRIERDLHDGTQQRLVSLALGLRAAEADVPPDRAELRAELARVASGLGDAVDELREISRGIHPAVLSEGGLGPALQALARRSRVPVELEASIDRRLPEPLEAAAYYVASEALTNVAKHADASVVRVSLDEQNGTLRLSIRDDGSGGVDPRRGSGLVGLRDRVEALGGKITIDSTPGAGTSLVTTLPLDDGTAGTGE
jgi:GAF domain-containing protein